MFYPRILLSIIATAALVVASAQQLTVTLTGSMHNGSSIPCFGKKVGTITSTVTGGTAPYTYDWSNGESTPSITDVSAGYYSVNVKDANGTEERAEITLTEPEELKVTATVSSFANGHNISCFECNNGYIQVSATQGTPPYSYAWSDGPSNAQNRYALGPKAYKVIVTDANGCESSTSVTITQPERSDWTMTGNAGTNPATQYIGTSDNKDVVFKANGQEALRLKANGDISLLGSMDGDGPLYRKEDGTLGIGFPVYPPLPAERCHGLYAYPYWETRGNEFSQLCPETDPVLGTLGSRPLKMVTEGVERLRITVDGKVGIGVTTPLMALHVQGGMLFHTPHGSIISSNDENDGMALWTRNNLASWGLSIDPSGTGHILGDMNDPRPALSFTYAGVTVANRLVVGDANGYRLFVQEGILTEKVKVAVRTSDEWSDHVFQPGYRLLPLKDVATFIKEHGHLPGVPSADQMVESGLDVVKTDAMLLEKIEEIALHLIAMEKRMAELEKENGKLRRLVGKL